MSQNARVGKRLPVINNVTVTRTVLQSQDIGSWKSAINQARDIYVPRRKLLQELYENIVLDGHLQGVMAKRTSHITNKKVAWVSRNTEEGGKEYDAIEANILRTPWFHDLLEGAMSQVFYGTTVLELVPKGGEISSVEVVPRANVVPELSMVLENANVWGIGINYLEDPLYSKWLIPVGKVKDYGGLMVAAQYAIWKRGGYADWAQYMELFGMPYRIGKYNPYDEHSRKKLDEALSNMGAAGHIVIPDGSSLEFLFPTNNSGTVDVYDKLIERANQEMSKLFLGNTLTTDAGERGARSLGEVHAKTEEDVVLSDMKRIEFLLNWELTERLLAMGYPVQNGDFRFEETTVLPVNEQIEVDMKVAQQVDIPEEYWYTRYGIPRPDSGTKVVLDDPEEEEEEDDDVPPDPPAGGQKKKDPPVRAEAAYRPRLSARLDTYYGLDKQPPQAAKPKGKGAPKHILDRIAEAVRNGEITEDSVDPALMQWIASEFTKHILGAREVGDDSAPPQITPEEERQIQVFSGFKTNAQLREATDALYNEHGRMVPFAEFKRRIRAIDATYNVRYLKAEYELARANRRSINRWRSLQATKATMPYGQYHTVGDERVRDAHAAMDGVIKHLDDPFWDVWWPPNGWNCRCTVLALSSDKGGKEMPANVVPPKTMFANNVGKNGALFPKGHPYAEQANASVREQVEALATDAMDAMAVTGGAWSWRSMAELLADKALQRRMARQWKAEQADAARWKKRVAILLADFVRRVLPGLSLAQQDAFKAYTGNGHSGINMHLRGIRENDTVKPDIALLRQALGKYPLAKPLLVYRDLPGSYGEVFLEQAKQRGVGAYGTLRGFSSTSVDPGVTEAPEKGVRKVALRLYLPAGTPAAYLEAVSLHPQEYEVLLDHGLAYRVLGWKEEEDVTFVDLLVVP